MQNLAFELQKDKGLRDDGLLQPFKIVSLWQLMKIFDAGELYFAILQLSHLLPPAQIGGTDQTVAIPLEDYLETKDRIDFVRTELERIQFVYALDCAHELHRVILEDVKETVRREPGRWMAFSPEAAYRYRMHMRDLATNFKRELSIRKVMFLSVGKTGYFDGSKVALSEKAKEQFPLAQKDFNEAGKCFAFGQQIACVFHLTRVMEQTVQKLGKRFDIPRYHKKTWGKILRKVNDKIGAMKEETAGQKIKKQRYYHTYDLLHSVCEGIRNPIVHPKISEIDVTYTEGEIENLLNRVKEFIDNFSTLR